MVINSRKCYTIEVASQISCFIHEIHNQKFGFWLFSYRVAAADRLTLRSDSTLEFNSVKIPTDVQPVIKVTYILNEHLIVESVFDSILVHSSAGGFGC